MTAPAPFVFLFDVDNTLLDNDTMSSDLRAYLTATFGEVRQQRYWAIFEEMRSKLGYADYLGALQRYRAENLRDPHMLAASNYLVTYPFEQRLFPGALDLLRALRQYGPVVVLSDGDVVFQPRKIARSGIWDAVEGNVLIYIHKEEMLDDVAARYPATRYVMVDDKIHILAKMKAIWGERLITVFVRQGHYAHDQRLLDDNPPADIAIERIGDLLDNPDFAALIGRC
jgi:FMN phosphatase YigB (HAD superfamily)